MTNADTLQPSYIIQNPDGTVGADFTGVIHALGIIIPAAAGASPGAANRIVWTRQSDGAAVATLWGADDESSQPPQQTAALYASAQSPGDLSNVALRANSDVIGDYWMAQVWAQQDGTPAGTKVVATAGDQVNGPDQQVDVIRADGYSSFLQLQGGSQPRAIAIGTGSATFTNSTVSAADNVAHNIGRPAAMFIPIITGDEYGGINPVWMKQNDTATTSQLMWVSQTALSLTVNFAWLAIG